MTSFSKHNSLLAVLANGRKGLADFGRSALNSMSMQFSFRLPTQTCWGWCVHKQRRVRKAGLAGMVERGTAIRRARKYSSCVIASDICRAATINKIVVPHHINQHKVLMFVYFAGLYSTTAVSCMVRMLRILIIVHCCSRCLFCYL